MKNPVQCRQTASRAVIIGCLVWLAQFSSEAAVHFVDPNSTNATAPYTNWATAARDIQSAVDAATIGDTVLVTNGTYATGGRAVLGTMTNRVAIENAITVQSVNGPLVTVIQGSHAPGATNGDGAARCAYLTNGASLIGFTLTNGATRTSGPDPIRESSGGGVFCESTNEALSNCILAGNSAWAYGGGVYGGTLNNCILAGNFSTRSAKVGAMGGGAHGAVLNNCTLTRNSAQLGGGGSSCVLSNCTLMTNSAGYGGGVIYGTLWNCTLVGNSSQAEGGGAYISTLYNCTLTACSATTGGGACYSTLITCTLNTNQTPQAGVGGGTYSSTLIGCALNGNISGNGCGAASSTLKSCVLAGNIAASFSSPALGGGAYQSTLDNCILKGNRGGYGGGALESTLNSCVLTDNSAFFGGGAYGGTMNNCTVISNSAVSKGGGTFEVVANNSIVCFNSSTSGPNYHMTGTNKLNFCCTTPVPVSGAGNIADSPGFLGSADGNLRLQSNSPCINVGNNASVTNLTDLDGRPRIVIGTVDIGAYEFQSEDLSRFLFWLEQYGLPTDGSADFSDPDGDGLDNWQEWRAGTDPTNGQSALRMIAANPGPLGISVSWRSVPGRYYFVQRASSLPAFQTIQGNIPGQTNTTTWLDGSGGTGPLFYRVGVQ